MRELSAQDLASVNDLLAGQLRAGLPLEPGLKAAAADWPGHAGSVLRDLTERLERGEPLEKALTDSSGRVPPAYSALIEAGRRSGKLPEVLDELTKLAELRIQARRTVTLALVYPSFVILIALLLGFFLGTRLIPSIVRDMTDAGIDPPFLVARAGAIGTWLNALVPPVLVFVVAALAALVLLIFLSNLGPWAERRIERLPWLGRAWKDAKIAYWAWLTAILLEHGTPEPETVELAAESSGFDKNRESVRAVADILRAGNRPSAADWHATGAPPLAIWALNSDGPVENRTALLRLISSTFETKSQTRLIVATRMIPLVLLVFVCGAFVLIYGLLLFVPLARLYEGLT